MKSWQEQKDAVEKAKAEFPETFGLRSVGLADTKGKRFRIGPHSYLNNSGVVMLYTDVQREDGTWVAFCKCTAQELKQVILP